MDWKEIEQQLCDRVEEVCRYLLPLGKRNGTEWCVGSVAGEAGDSMRVHLAGGASLKAGVWADFADSDKKGKTLLSLWCHVRAQAFPVCIREAKEWLGIREEGRERRIQRAGQSPNGAFEQRTANAEQEKSRWQEVGEIWPQCAPLTVGGPVWRYLVEERRLDEQVLEAYEVREMPLWNNAWAMVFPYYAPQSYPDGASGQSAIELAIAEMGKAAEGPSRSGQGRGPKPGGAEPGPGRTPTWLKFECVERAGGKKREWTTKGPEKCLWGMQLLPGVGNGHAMFRGAHHLLIVEGEKDALSWASYGCGNWRIAGMAGAGGVLPVSVPFGAKWRPAPVKTAHGFAEQRPSSNREWLDRCWDWMQGFETIFVGMDGDEEGDKAAADIISEIGPRRCRLVKLPSYPEGVLPGRGNGEGNG